MKPRPPHPDVTYWSCPKGDADVTILGAQFDLISFFGRVEPGDLAGILPASLLDQAEALVEGHEAKHLTGGSRMTNNVPAAASHGGMQRPGRVGTNRTDGEPGHPPGDPAGLAVGAQPRAGRVTPRTSAGRDAKSSDH